MITADQVAVAVFADYIAQSDWMARCKTSETFPAFVHAFLYTLCFLVLTTHFDTLLVIGVTHFLIDRFRLARYVVWLKNGLNPQFKLGPLTATGYPDDAPVWLTVWLMIITDNWMHIVINALALHYLG